MLSQQNSIVILRHAASLVVKISLAMLGITEVKLGRHRTQGERLIRKIAMGDSLDGAYFSNCQ
jgi:hypothetical protein